MMIHSRALDPPKDRWVVTLALVPYCKQHNHQQKHAGWHTWRFPGRHDGILHSGELYYTSAGMCKRKEPNRTLQEKHDFYIQFLTPLYK